MTIPHKAAAAELADSHGPEVKASGAANPLLFDADGGPVRAENTDGAGLIAALADLDVFVRGGLRIVMVGGRGRRGAIEALTRAGANVEVLARRPAAAEEILRGLPAAQVAHATAAGWTADALAYAMEGADAVVSAVPAAAWAGEAACAGLRTLTANIAVLEMAYGGGTPLVFAARRATDRYADGLGMLVHQAARAIELASGRARRCRRCSKRRDRDLRHPSRLTRPGTAL